MIAYALVMKELTAKERRERTACELAKLPFKVEEWFGMRSYVGDWGCSMSHQKMLMEAYRKKDDLLCFEDDVRINDVPLLLKQIEDALADDYVDILYLSFHPPMLSKDKILEETDKWYRIRGVWGSHAILYKKNAIRYLVSLLDSDGTCKRMGAIHNQNIDVTMTQEIHPIMNCVCGKQLPCTMYGGTSIRMGAFRSLNVHDETLSQFEKLKEAFYVGSRN